MRSWHRPGLLQNPLADAMIWMRAPPPHALSHGIEAGAFRSCYGSSTLEHGINTLIKEGPEFALPSTTRGHTEGAAYKELSLPGPQMHWCLDVRLSASGTVGKTFPLFVSHPA